MAADNVDSFGVEVHVEGATDVLHAGAGAKNVVGTTKSGFHYATGGTENGGGTGRFAEVSVELVETLSDIIFSDGMGVLKVLSATDHVSKLSDGDGGFHVNTSLDDVIALNLGLLSGTGHAAENGVVFGLVALGLHVLVDHGGGHGKRGLAGGKILLESGELLLDERVVAGAAGGNEGKLELFFGVGHTSKKLLGLLNDGGISASLHVKDLVKAEAADTTDHKLGKLVGVGTGKRSSEGLSKTDAGSGGSESNADLASVLGGLEFGAVLARVDSTDWAAEGSRKWKYGQKKTI